MEKVNIKDLVYIVCLSDILILYDKLIFERHAHIISTQEDFEDIIVLADDTWKK